MRQQLWRLTDAGAQHQVVELLADKKVYIADGHHRYETMLALRDELRAESANNPRSSVEYGTIFLANMDDPGLLVFPTHRVVHGLPRFDRASPARARAQFFAVEDEPPGDAGVVRARLAEQRGKPRPTFAHRRRRRASPT